MKYKSRPGIHPIHTGDHPCSFCKKVFTSRESVQMHEKSIHKKQIKKALEELRKANATAVPKLGNKK